MSKRSLIECVHFNDKYPQFKNIAITNLKDNIAYKYDNIDNKLPEKNIKIKPNATVKQKGFLPFRGGKKKTRKHKRKRATRRRARRAPR